VPQHCSSGVVTLPTILCQPQSLRLDASRIQTDAVTGGPPFTPSRQCSCCIAMQVPFHLGQAACSAPNPLTPRGYAALWALRHLLSKANADGALVGKARTAGPAGRLAKAVALQLQQSGLVAALPRLLDAAAATLSHSQHSSDAAHAADIPAAAIACSAAHRVRTRSAASKLLQLLCQCNALLPWPVEVDFSSALLPAARACVAALQHCSRCDDLTPLDAPAPPPPN
jgi:hypothetical protein